MPPSFAADSPGATRVAEGAPQADPSSGRRGWRLLVVGCLALAGLSLVVLPSSLGYDPWSWLIWGREILHLDLNTRKAATAVKPLTMVLDALFALTGSAAAPALSLLVARAAALASIALAFRIGRRLSGVGAGLIAAGGLAITDQYFSYLFMRGMSEPAATAAALAAVESHLVGNRRATLGWLAVAGLLRPEAWPFLFGYCVWQALSGPAWRRIATITVSVVVPASWFVLDWFGSGKLTNSAEAAKRTSQGGPLLSHNPGLATFRETWHLMSGPVIVLFLVGFAWWTMRWLRSRQTGPGLWLSIGAIGWLIIDAVLAQGRFATGAPRYLLPGAALACVAIGILVTDTARAFGRSVIRTHATAGAVAVAIVALGLVDALRLSTTVHELDSGIRFGRDYARQPSTLDRAVRLAGGREAVVRCGTIVTQAFQVPLVAWTLRVHVGAVGIDFGVPGSLLQEDGAPKLPSGLTGSFDLLGAAGPTGARWTVLSTCPPL